MDQKSSIDQLNPHLRGEISAVEHNGGDCIHGDMIAVAALEGEAADVDDRDPVACTLIASRLMLEQHRTRDRMSLLKKCMKVPVLLSACVAVWGCGSPAQTHPDPRFDKLAAAVRADLQHNHATAASVAVWLDGEVVWVGGFGHADPGGTTAPDEATRFMIGSDTKKITALSLLRKVAAGRVTLDTTVAQVLPQLHMTMAPGFPAATLRQLLSHRGGIVDGWDTTTSTTDAALAAYAYGDFATMYYPLAPPGMFYNYSNPNFSIAGLIDQQIDGRAWPDIVEQDIFAPLEMTRTVARKSELDDDTAPGVGMTVSEPNDSVYHPVTLENTWEAGFARPAGLVWSTPSDQMRLAAFLVDGDARLLDPALLHELTTAQTPQYPDIPLGYGPLGYGLGLNTGRGLKLGDAWYDVEVWSHGGGTFTHTSTFYVLPAQRFAISILSNGRYDDFTKSWTTAMLTLVDLPAPGAMPPLPFEPAQLDALTGTYVDEFQLGEVIVTRVGDALNLDIPRFNDSAVPYEHGMTRVTTRVWIATLGGIPQDVSFIDGPNGETYLRSREAVAVRAPAGIRAAAKSPSRRLDRSFMLRWLEAVARDETLALLRATRDATSGFR